MNSTVDDTTTTACQTCGQVFSYEPIMVFGRDLAAGLHRHCEDCQAKEQKAEEAARKESATEAARASLRAMLPPDLLETDPYHAEFNLKVWDAVRRWNPSSREFSLGIIGPAARCKTRIMALLAKRVVHRDTRIVWTSAVRLADAARDRTSNDRGIMTTAREHLQDCLTAPWLFLDDLGKNEWHRSFESQLFQILDHRIGYHLPTVWTANDHPDAFSQLISSLNVWPIIGRLLDRTTLIDLRED